MKKVIYSLILVLSLNQASAQDNRFSIGFSAFPNYSLGIIKAKEQSILPIQEGIQERETWKPAVSGTVFAEYKLNDKSALGFGLGYQNNGERTRKMDLIFGVDPQTGELITDPSWPKQSRMVYNHHNIEIPVFYRYQFSQKWYARAGFSNIINLTNTATSKLYFESGEVTTNTQKDESTDFRTYNLSVNLGVGFDFVQADKITAFIEPYGQYGVMGISSSAPINRNILSLGFSLGIRLK
jgi:hypothetical protein